MNPRRFELISEWHLAASPEQVWAVLAHPEDWPRWWPYVRNVVLVKHGDADGLGDIRQFSWASALPYGLKLNITTTASTAPTHLVAQANGDLCGRGEWQIAPIPVGTRVRYIWQVELEKSWMRWLAPLLAPIFSWNHHVVMRSGARNMAKWLGVELIDYNVVTQKSNPANQVCTAPLPIKRLRAANYKASRSNTA